MATRTSQRVTVRERRILRLFVLAVVCLSVLILLFAPGRGLLVHRKLKKEINTLIQKNKDLQKSNVELAEEIERLKHDEAYLEYLARHKYNMLKDNEEVYIFKKATAGSKKTKK